MKESYVPNRFMGQYFLPTVLPEVYSNELTIPYSLQAAEIVRVSVELLGAKTIKYRRSNTGLTTESGFDCSGFVNTVIETSRKQYPEIQSTDNCRHANELFERYGTYIDQKFKMPGDLVFFSRDGISVNHVGIYVGEDENGIGYYIHSPGKDGKRVVMSKLIYRKIVAKSTQPRFTQSPIGFKRPLIIKPSNCRDKQYSATI